MRSKRLFVLTLIFAVLLMILIGLVFYVLNRENDPDTKVPGISADNGSIEASPSEKPRDEASAPDTNSPDQGEVPETIDDSGKTDGVSDNNTSVTGDLNSNDSDSNDSDSDGSDVSGSDTSADTLQKAITLVFAGDINLDEDSKPVARYDREQKGISGCISPGLIDEMTSADIMMLNNEFAFSNRGTEEQNKSYTFRAKPERVGILKEMGVDIVSLANNHALDFGMEALLDTFETLENNGIDYVGAGRNLDRAKAPVYYEIGGLKIAFLAASRVVFAMDWYAGKDSPGMVGTYDPALILESIREAKAESDFVVIYLHWGIERTNYPVDYQKELARKYIDAGADVVVGCHPHVMQGFEFYKDKPIAYSLGNYWFNASKRETGLLKITINPDKSFTAQLIPAMSENTYTYMLEDEADREKYYNFIKEISFGVEIDDNGYIRQTSN